MPSLTVAQKRSPADFSETVGMTGGSFSLSDLNTQSAPRDETELNHKERGTAAGVKLERENGEGNGQTDRSDGAKQEGEQLRLRAFDMENKVIEGSVVALHVHTTPFVLPRK